MRCALAAPAEVKSSAQNGRYEVDRSGDRAKIHLSVDGFTSLVDQTTVGPGQSPPEGPGFAAGSPLSPMTPYDTFTSAPNVPGVTGVTQLLLTGAYEGHSLRASATIGVGYATGSVQNAVYWTERIMPTLDPHLGSQTLPYAISFPTHAGQDDASAAGVSLLSARIANADGSLALKGGWFDLTQSDRFVFLQPPLTNATPAIAIATAESLGDGPPALASWPSPPPGLPLHGVDLVARKGIATVEATDALLPALAGTRVRLYMISGAIDHGEGTRWSAQVAHVTTGGALISTTTMFGQGAMTIPGPQGPLPSSMLGAQRQTLAGIRGAFHAARGLDAVVEIGRAWYDADHVLLPGTSRPGGFYHVALAHAIGRATAGAEFFRFEPRYATAILPYGIPENVWSVAWSWPGPWLKSNYQLADNTALGINRQGYRLKYALASDPFAFRISYATYRQIEPSTLDRVEQVGFVDGFLLPQFANAATLGTQHQLALWAAWHPSASTVWLDYVEDTQHRPFVTAHPEDAVWYFAPQYVLGFSRALSKRALIAAGLGRYGMRGSWAMGAATNVDYAQRVIFAGAQFAQTARTATLVQLRWTSFSGLPSMPGGTPPDFHGTMLVFEQRYHM